MSIQIPHNSQNNLIREKDGKSCQSRQEPCIPGEVSN